MSNIDDPGSRRTRAALAAHEEEHPPVDRVLGSLSGESAQSSLSGDAPAMPRVSRRKQSAAATETGKLPRGIWLRLRVSGGLAFRTSQTVVFTGGRLVYDHSGIGGVGKLALTRELSEQQQDELRAALVALADARSEPATRGGGDVLVYEFDAKSGKHLIAVSAAAYAMTDRLAHVVQLLGALIRVDAGEFAVAPINDPGESPVDDSGESPLNSGYQEQS